MITIMLRRTKQGWRAKIHGEGTELTFSRGYLTSADAADVCARMLRDIQERQGEEKTEGRDSDPVLPRTAAA